MRPVTLVVLGLAAHVPAHAVKVCSADCESEVKVDTSTSPCTYTWADAKFQIPVGSPSPGTALTLRWKLTGPASAIWTNDGVFLLTPPENDPEQDLTGNGIDGKGYYKWDVVHLRPMKKFTIEMNIFNGSVKCQKAPSQGAYEIELR